MNLLLIIVLLLILFGGFWGGHTYGGPNGLGYGGGISVGAVVVILLVLYFLGVL